jgi:hypothetical protein
VWQVQEHLLSVREPKLTAGTDPRELLWRDGKERCRPNLATLLKPDPIRNGHCCTEKEQGEKEKAQHELNRNRGAPKQLRRYVRK